MLVIADPAPRRRSKTLPGGGVDGTTSVRLADIIRERALRVAGTPSPCPQLHVGGQGPASYAPRAVTAPVHCSGSVGGGMESHKEGTRTDRGQPWTSSRS